MHAQTFVATLLLAATGASAAAVKARDDMIAEIKGWNEVSDCSSTQEAAIDFYLSNSTSNAGALFDCGHLPNDTVTVQVVSLYQNFQGT
jgi:hypothetical protein